MPDTNNHRIFWGNILRKLRYDHNLTQDEVAEMLHMTRQRYSNYECGKRHPSPELIAIISDLYDVDLNKYVIELMPKNFVAEHNNYKVHIKRIRKKAKKNKPTDDSDDDLLIIED